MKFTAFTLLFTTCLSVFSQQKEIDSIKQILPDQEALDQVKSLNELSWYYRNFDLDSAIVLANSALQIGEELASKPAISQSYNSLANAFESKGLLDSALTFHQRAFSIKQELGDSLGMASSLNNQGIVYDELGNYAASLQSYFRSLRLYEAVSKEPYDIAMVLGNIGIVYKKQKEYDKVLEYYQRALTLYTEVESAFGQTVTKGNIGGVLLLTGDYKNAIEYSQAALDGYEEAGYSRYVPYMMGNIGVAYDSLGETLKARELYLQAQELHTEHENSFELSNTLVALSHNYRSTGNYALGISSAEKALAYAQKIEAKEFEVKALYELSKNLAAQGNFKKAFATVASYNALRDSLEEQNKTKELFELRTQYETEKKVQQIALQQAQLSEQNAQILKNQTLLYFSLFASTLLIIIGFLWRNRMKKKQEVAIQKERLHAQEAEINATISSQEKERARYARDLHDGFGQMISILNMNLQSLNERSKPNEREKVFKESSKVLDDMYGELKSICFDLMPQTLINSGLESALTEFASRINAGGKIQLEINVFGIEDRLTELHEISLYRIAQEWINNIIKYSDASKVTLQITRDDDEITLLIEDDGSGFDKSLLESSSGHGWKNMNVRANLIRGVIELESAPGSKGNSLILNAPVAEKASKNTKNIASTV